MESRMMGNYHVRFGKDSLSQVCLLRTVCQFTFKYGCCFCLIRSILFL